MSRVAVSRGVLQWALDRRGASVSDLETKFPRLAEWLEGLRQPTLRQLERFAKATATPLGFLFLEQPPEERLPIPHFRTIESTEPQSPSPELLDTFYSMQRRQLWLRDFLEEEGCDALPFVASAKKGEETVSVAVRMRNLLGFQEGWAARERRWQDALGTLRGKMEDAGIFVAVNGVVENNTHRKLDIAEFRGFVLVDEYAPLVFVNGADAKAAQMFTLAHELAHVFYGSSAAFDLRQMQPADDPIEKTCNQVAAEFLVPREEVVRQWQRARRAREPYEALARHFKVSQIVAARRALDTGLVSKKEFFDFYEAYQEKRRQRSSGGSGGNFYYNQNLRVGKRFARIVATAAESGNIPYSEAYRLTGLHGKTFHKYVKSLRIGGLE